MEFKEQEIKKIAEANNIDLVVLYGSQISGITGPMSDIDIAVRLKTPKIDHQSFLKIIGCFARIFDDRIDLVFLNEAPPMLKYQIAVYGEVLYESIPGLFNLFKIGSAHHYADTKKFRDLNSVFIERFLRGDIPIAG